MWIVNVKVFFYIGLNFWRDRKRKIMKVNSLVKYELVVILAKGIGKMVYNGV